jgi:hypothetical protein
MAKVEFQGDIMVISQINDYYSTVPGTTVDEKLQDGSIVVSHGEGRDHYHVVRGSNVMVKELRSGQSLHHNSGVRTWAVYAPEGAVLEHVKGDGTKTLEHGTHTIPAGHSVLSDQREATYSKGEQVRHID